MTILTDHSWIIGLLVMYLNLGIGRVKMRALVAEGRLSDFEANRFCIYAALAFAALFGAIEVFSVASGIPPQCQMLLPMTDRAVWPSYLLTLLSGIAFLYWVWRRGGDRTLALVGPAFTRGSAAGKNYTPRQVRVALTGLIVLAWGGYAVMHFVLPMPSEMPGCPGRPPNPGVNPTALPAAG